MRSSRLTAVLTVVAAVFAGLPAAARAASASTTDARVVPIQVTGPAASRFNLVVMGDGYTAAELPKFREQLDKHLNVLWSIEPFKSYRNYINVYAVEIASPESGVDCDPNLTSPKVDTPLQMGFWGGCNPNSVQRLLTVSATAAVLHADLVDGTTAANHQILAIGNSDTYGGAGGTYSTASGGNALSALITPVGWLATRSSGCRPCIRSATSSTSPGPWTVRRSRLRTAVPSTWRPSTSHPACTR